MRLINDKCCKAYRGQVANFYPKSMIWELFHPLGSNNQSLIEETSNQVNRQNTEYTERRAGLWLLIVTVYNAVYFNVTGLCVITDSLYAHNEYYGAGAEPGRKSWAHCTGIQLKQVETVTVPMLVLQYSLQLALGVWWGETKVKQGNTTSEKETGCQTAHYIVETLGNVRIIYINKDGWFVCTSSLCTKMKPKHSRYRYCHLALVMSFGVYIIETGGWNRDIEISPVLYWCYLWEKFLGC